MEFKDLVGKTLVKINGLEENSERVEFVDSDGQKYIMYHAQDCCESVSINDVCGNVLGLIGTPILMAEEKTSDIPVVSEADSFTWTFYTLATKNGFVDIRWFGESNGYYSEGVDFKEVSMF